MDNPWESFREAMLNGHYFEAHEILEVPWRQHRNIHMQIAIWLAAAFVHWSNGRYGGAEHLLTRIANHPAAVDLPLLDAVNRWLSQVHNGDPVMPWTAPEIDHVLAWGRHGS